MSNQTAQEVAVKTYNMDPSHSRMGFTARHMGFTKVHGSFDEFKGTLRLDPNDLTTLEAEAVIEAASINTREAKRDAHLRTGDFLLVDEHPQITFKSTEVRNVRGNNFTLVGDLTIRGVTKRVELESEYLGSGKDPWGGTRVAFEGRTNINRKDFGVNWNAILETGGFLVSDNVDITLEVQAVEQSA